MHFIRNTFCKTLSLSVVCGWVTFKSFIANAEAIEKIINLFCDSLHEINTACDFETFYQLSMVNKEFSERLMPVLPEKYLRFYSSNDLSVQETYNKAIKELTPYACWIPRQHVKLGVKFLDAEGSLGVQDFIACFEEKSAFFPFSDKNQLSAEVKISLLLLFANEWYQREFTKDFLKACSQGDFLEEKRQCCLVLSPEKIKFIKGHFKNYSPKEGVLSFYRRLHTLTLDHLKIIMQMYNASSASFEFDSAFYLAAQMNSFIFKRIYTVFSKAHRSFRPHFLRNIKGFQENTLSLLLDILEFYGDIKVCEEFYLAEDLTLSQLEAIHNILENIYQNNPQRLRGEKPLSLQTLLTCVKGIPAEKLLASRFLIEQNFAYLLPEFSGVREEDMKLFNVKDIKGSELIGLLYAFKKLPENKKKIIRKSAALGLEPSLPEHQYLMWSALEGYKDSLAEEVYILGCNLFRIIELSPCVQEQYPILPEVQEMLLDTKKQPAAYQKEYLVMLLNQKGEVLN